MAIGNRGYSVPLWTVHCTVTFFGVIFSPLSVVAENADSPLPEQVEFFEKRIRPVLVEHCYKCHSAEADKVKGGLLLDSRAGLLKGGELGSAFSSHEPSNSLFLEAVGWKSQDLQMPPKQPLSPTIQADLEKWINMGAPWPGSVANVGPTKTDSEGYDFEKEREHWSFQPVQKPELPAESSGREIDWLIRKTLTENNLSPSPEAPRYTLIRRAYLTMTGLPPTPEDVAEFIDGHKTWEQVIEELLASPQYGAKWARHWLDVARFADGYGGFLDAGKFDNAWRYRDWVMDAINDDIPYDRFLQLQIIGDIIDPKESSVATGFLALGPQYKGDGGDKLSNAIAKAETLDDRVDTVGRGILGLTLACARCHDHKFDPIPTIDYYSIAGIFRNTGVGEQPLVPNAVVDAWNAKIKAIADYNKETENTLQKRGDQIAQGELKRLAEYALLSEEYRNLPGKKPDLVNWAREQGYSGAVFRFAYPFFSKPNNSMSQLTEADAWFKQRSSDSLASLRSFLIENPEDARAKEFMKKVFKVDRNQALQELEKSDAAFAEMIKKRRVEFKEKQKNQPDKYDFAHVLKEQGTGDMKVAIRGNLLTEGELAPRRFLRILDEEQPPFSEGSGRKQLASALVSPANPLTARVFVNRVWGWHFGNGLVRTPSNFGKLGERPSHPELLDWLAATFVEDGWSIKRLHRRILTSATWKQSSQFNAGSFAVDGDNRFLWRMNPRKLTVEVWRDSMLHVSGKLDPALGGKPFTDPSSDFRRTIHARTSRNGDQFASDPFLRLFDFPVPRSSIAKRTPTITPQQSLFLLNNPFVGKQAEALAERINIQGNDEVVEKLYRILFSRSPQAEELKVAEDFLGLKEEVSTERLTRYARALLASNEFKFVE